MAKRILVTGATGFCGRHLVRRLVEAGHTVRVLVRSPRKAAALLPTGVEVVAGDVTEAASLPAAVQGVEAVAHLVGLIRDAGANTLERVHVDGTRHLLEAAKAAGVPRFYLQSATGVRPGGTRYQTTKAAAEQLVRESGLAWVVLRPSFIVGPGGEFVGTLANLLTRAPIVPVFGDGTYLVQPVDVDDLNACVQQALERDDLARETACIGGPDALAWNELLEVAGEVLGVRKPLVHVPFPLARAALSPPLGALLAPAARIGEALLGVAPVDADQLAMLEEGSTCDLSDMRRLFGVEPRPFRKAFARAIA